VYTVYTGPLHIITSAYIIVFIHYTSLPGPPAILYSAYRPFDMFLLSSRYNLKFHAFLRGIIVYTNSLHIIATAYIIVFIHYTNSPAYSATGYIIVCIQGRAPHWFPSGTMSGATRWSLADVISTWLFLTTIAWQKTPTNSVGQTRRVRGWSEICTPWVRGLIWFLKSIHRPREKGILGSFFGHSLKT